MKLCPVTSIGQVLRSELPDVDVDADTADDEDEVARCCKSAHTNMIKRLNFSRSSPTVRIASLTG